jgi:hypothetical protein
MCVAILVPMGADISTEQLRMGAGRNPDGWGYSFVRNGKTIIRKGIGKWEDHGEADFNRDFKRYIATSAFLIHFRVRSHGEICAENSHPFHIKGGGAMIHNGVLDLPNLPANTSDTKHFVENWVSKLPAGWNKDKFWQEMMQRFIGKANKMCFLFPDGDWLILNPSAGHWDKEPHKSPWFSNYSCSVYKAPVVNTNPKASTTPTVTTEKRGENSTKVGETSQLALIPAKSSGIVDKWDDELKQGREIRRNSAIVDRGQSSKLALIERQVIAILEDMGDQDSAEDIKETARDLTIASAKNGVCAICGGDLHLEWPNMPHTCDVDNLDPSIGAIVEATREAEEPTPTERAVIDQELVELSRARRGARPMTQQPRYTVISPNGNRTDVYNDV